MSKDRGEAKAIGLPYAQPIAVAKKTKEQTKLENSRQQYLNVQGAFKVDREACLPGPVLLVDDTVDSKWTLTEAGATLQKAVTVAVVPFALASSAISG